MNKQPETSEAEWVAAHPQGPYENKTIAEIVHDYAVIRGDLCEQYARDQLVRVIEGRVAAERVRAAQEALAPLRARIATCGHVEEPWPEGCWPCEVRALLPAEEWRG